jgi:hypothetical protein
MVFWKRHITAQNPFVKLNQGKRKYLRFKFVTKIISV